MNFCFDYVGRLKLLLVVHSLSLLVKLDNRGILLRIFVCLLVCAVVIVVVVVFLCFLFLFFLFACIW